MFAVQGVLRDERNRGAVLAMASALTQSVEELTAQAMARPELPVAVAPAHVVNVGSNTPQHRMA
jgi:hypothetical protein